jgi:hypothetical protein
MGNWQITVKPLSSISYVASGGYRGPQLYPERLLPWVIRLDEVLGCLPYLFATRLLVVLTKHR